MQPCHALVAAVACFLAAACAATGPKRLESVSAAAQPQRSLCDLIDSWKDYHLRRVRVKAIFFVGPEQLSLYDPGCHAGKERVWADVETSLQSADLRKLNRIVKHDHRAWIVLEGVFHGPEPMDADPRLPSPYRENLQGLPRRYGHMGAYDTMIEATRIIEVRRVERGVPW